MILWQNSKNCVCMAWPVLGKNWRPKEKPRRRRRKWLLEHLLQQKQADRAVRSVNHQMNMAKLPMHRDLAGFDFSASSADARLVRDLANLELTDTAQNVVFIGGPGTGQIHLATALTVSGITTHNKRVRFYSTVDLVNLLEREKNDGRRAESLKGCYGQT